MKDKNGIIGFALLGILMLAYFWIDGQKRAAGLEEQRIQDSIEQSMVVPTPEIDSNTVARIDSSTLVNNTLSDSAQDLRLVLQYGDFAISSTGEEKDYVLENNLAKFTFTNKGGKIKQVQLKEFQKSIWNKNKEKEISDLVLLEDERNRFGYQLPINGVATPISTEDLYFTVAEVTGSRIVFRAFAGSPDRYFEQVYSLGDDYTLDYDINFVGLDGTIPSSTKDIQLDWVNYLDRIEKSTDYESSLSTAYYKVSDKSPSYCSCRGDDEVSKEKPMDWVAHSNQFFNTTIIGDSPFASMNSEVKVFDKEDDDLKVLSTSLQVPLNDRFGMRIYSGPNEYKRLAAFDNDMEYVIPYGRSILGTINRWVIRPIFSFFSGFIGNMGLVILLVTFLIKMALYPLTYKMLYSQSKMSALKPQIEALKKKLGDDDPQAVQVETMKLYRETGVNPLGGCMPMVIQMPIWIALYRFFPASIEFRQASFLWADDLASFDVFTWLPFDIPFYGAHLSLFTILWAITTVIYTFYNSKHMDMSANPSMKYMQYLMPLMFLFFFNSMAAALTCYMLFSNLVNIGQTIITKSFIINKKKVAEEIANYKKKPKKEGGFRDKLGKAFEEAQKAQEARQKADKTKKEKISILLSKNFIWVGIITLVFISFSCTKKVSDRVVTPPQMPIEQDFEITSIDTSLIEETEVILIEKQKFSVVHIIKEPCYGGGCPVFEFSLLNDGIAFYSCKVGCEPKRGQFYAYIGKDKSAEILDYIHRFEMMQLNSTYPSNGRPVANIPLTKITLSIDEDRSKEISNYHHSPASLIQLEEMVGELISVTNWELTYE